MKHLLHVGSGGEHILGKQGFNKDEWREERLDINPEVGPDIVCSMVNMHIIADNSYDAIYSSHNLEHLYWHEAQHALKEFHRVLKDGGFAKILTPDIQHVAEMVSKGQLLTPAYHTASGHPIAPLDMIWGWHVMLEQGNHYMAHKCGFTLDTLILLCSDAGFTKVEGNRSNYTLTVTAIK